MVFVGERELAALHHQGIVPIGLNQAHKSVNIVSSDVRVEKNVTAAVLVDIAIITVALRVIFCRQGKGILISFGITRCAGVNVIRGVILAQQDGPAASQNVI